jgi:acetyltransferase-like isoleucine patch superfamily enzyme
MEPKGIKSITDCHIGIGVRIDQSVEFINVEKLFLGDYVYLGPGVRIIGGSFAVGDYSKVHNNCYIYSKNYIHLGHNTWIGQGTHLDGTGGIKVGHFMGVGINSALYSHIRHGDITEGCNFEKDSILEIGDDVWLVGMCLVSPVKVADKSLALLGSVITRDMEFNKVYGGNPAIDLTSKVGEPWKQTSLDEKVNSLNRHLNEYSKINSEFIRDSVFVSDSFPSEPSGRTCYNVASREYIKTNSKEEYLLNSWLFPYRAKFKPRDVKSLMNCQLALYC